MQKYRWLVPSGSTNVPSVSSCSSPSRNQPPPACPSEVFPSISPPRCPNTVSCPPILFFMPHFLLFLCTILCALASSHASAEKSANGIVFLGVPGFRSHRRSGHYPGLSWRTTLKDCSLKLIRIMATRLPPALFISLSLRHFRSHCRFALERSQGRPASAVPRPTFPLPLPPSPYSSRLL